MKFSSKGHYGLRAMVVLAEAYGLGPLALAEVARMEDMSLGYLEQLMASLRRAGLVEGTRGAHGGYRLASHPSSITVGDILRTLEGPIAPAECASEVVGSGLCRREDNCPSRVVWELVRDAIAQLLDSTTLADLCQRRQRDATVVGRSW